MSYKKLVSLLAVSALALGACGNDTTDDAAEPEVDETEEVEETEVEEGSTLDAIEQAKSEAGDAFPDYGLTVSGDWTVDGYSIGHPEGEAAVIPVSIITEKDTYNVYLLENGLVTDMVSNEDDIEFTVEEPSADVEYHVGISPEELGEMGDEVNVEDFKRSEKIIFTVAEPEAEEE